MAELPEGWSLDEHGNAYGPYGVRVFIDFEGRLHMIQTPNCGEPAPWDVVTFLREEYVKMLREHDRVKDEELAKAVKPPRFEVGDRLKMNCPDKHEHGSSGEVIRVSRYSGPRTLDDWEYVVDIDSGSMEGTRLTVPQRWAVEED